MRYKGCNLKLQLVVALSTTVCHFSCIEAVAGSSHLCFAEEGCVREALLGKWWVRHMALLETLRSYLLSVELASSWNFHWSFLQFIRRRGCAGIRLITLN